jgi:hypothetical protein
LPDCALRIAAFGNQGGPLTAPPAEAMRGSGRAWMEPTRATGRLFETSTLTPRSCEILAAAAELELTRSV